MTLCKILQSKYLRERNYFHFNDTCKSCLFKFGVAYFEYHFFLFFFLTYLGSLSVLF